MALFVISHLTNCSSSSFRSKRIHRRISNEKDQSNIWFLLHFLFSVATQSQPSCLSHSLDELWLDNSREKFQISLSRSNSRMKDSILSVTHRRNSSSFNWLIYWRIALREKKREGDLNRMSSNSRPNIWWKTLFLWTSAKRATIKTSFFWTKRSGTAWCDRMFTFVQRDDLLHCSCHVIECLFCLVWSRQEYLHVN